MSPARHRRIIIPGLGILLFLSWAILVYGAQSGATSRRTTSGPSHNPPPGLSNPDQKTSQSLFITGVAVLEDGAPASASARVECTCSSRVKKTVAVDSRGYFSLQIGGNTRYSTLIPDTTDDSTGAPDVSISRASRRIGQPAWVDLMSSESVVRCELRARLDGFRSNTVVLEGIKSLGQIDVGTLVLYPVHKVPGTLVSVTSLQASTAARKALERAEKALQQKDLDKAEREMKTAVEVYPKYAEAWFGLGQVYLKQSRIQDARDAYGRALAADANYVRPYIQLARLAGLEQKWREAADITDHALALDPLDFPEAYYLNSVAYYSLNKLDAAERSARKVERLDPMHRIPEICLVLADILEQKKDLAGSIEQLQNYLQILPNAASADQVRSRIKELEEALNKGD